MGDLKRIGILTSGGDCGGLNGVIRGAALSALSAGIESVLITNGYAGLYNLVDFPELRVLDRERLDLIEVFMAGSEAGNSRVKIGKIKDEGKYERIKQGLAKHNLDALVIAGGDDTGSVVVDLAEKGIPCIHAPKTMDLDLMPYSVGGDSTINRIADFARELRTTGFTHNRIIVMEVFGRYAGHTAFRGGVAAQADAVLIPEIPVDFDVLFRQLKEVYFRRLDSSDVHAASAMVVVAEGLRDASGAELVDMSSEPDAFGHRRLAGAGKYVTQQLESRMKADQDSRDRYRQHGIFVEGINEVPEIREVRPGHLVRCGITSAVDAAFGLEVGAGAVHLAREGVFGVTVTACREGVVEYMDVKDAIVQRFVDPATVALYESMGVSFGREFAAPAITTRKVTGTPIRPH